MVSQGESDTVAAFPVPGPILRWQATVATVPTRSLIGKAIASVRGGRLPIVALESARGTLEACFGTYTTLMSWVAKGQPPRISERSDFRVDEVVEAMMAFIENRARGAPLPAWREAVWPVLEGPEIEELCQSAVRLARQIRSEQESLDSRQYWHLIRGVAYGLSHKAARCMPIAESTDQANISMEEIGCELDLWILDLLHEELLELASDGRNSDL